MVACLSLSPLPPVVGVAVRDFRTPAARDFLDKVSLVVFVCPEESLGPADSDLGAVDVDAAVVVVDTAMSSASVTADEGEGEGGGGRQNRTFGSMSCALYEARRLATRLFGVKKLPYRCCCCCCFLYFTLI